VLDEKFKPLEITRSQAWLMAYVSREDGQTQSDLAEQMSLGKVAIGGLIDRLEKTEMIERRAELTDRRVRKIYLTEKGKKVILLMRDITMEANDTILGGLSIKEIKQAVKVLDKIKKNVESMMG
jgi:DNA-binding MarR family transcriptional regulator